ncbi:MAG: hypothetical protein HFJ35_04095 [Clostridia bacterium]|nr:hypothetical protein [Clostridia bacterium]
MGKEKFEARISIGDLHEEKHLMIEIKDVEDGQYGLGTAYPIKNLSNEELIQKFIEELKHIDNLGYIIHYQ